MFTQYARMMATSVIRYSRGELGAVFSARTLHLFLNRGGVSQKFSIYMVRKLLKYWNEARWVTRFGNQYYFTNLAARDLLGE